MTTAGLSVGTLPAAEPAVAKTYEVTACDHAPGSVNNAWESYSGGKTRASQACPSGNVGFNGLAASSSDGAGGTVPDDAAGWRFTAPAGTTLASIRFSGAAHRSGTHNNWSARIVTSRGDSLYGFQGNAGGMGTLGFVDETRALGGATGVLAEVRCHAGGAECTTDGQAARVTMYGATVAVEDPTPPQVGEIFGELHEETWVRGSGDVGYRATDNTGIKAGSLSVANGGTGADQAIGFECDYTQRVPCSDQSVVHTFDSRLLADGSHTVNLTALDAAANETTVEVPIKVDNTAPTLTHSARSGYSERAVFTLNATDTTSGMGPAGLDRPSEDGGFVEYQIDGGAHQRARGASVPVTIEGDGSHSVRFWAKDVAGNVASPQVISFTVAPPTRTDPVRPTPTPDPQAGNDGAPGADGRDGTDGRDGVPGPQGPAGGAGSNGRDGKSIAVLTTAELNRLRVSVRVAPKRVVNGKTVRFSGAVTTGSTPVKGTAVVLQAKVGGRWVTFKHVTTNEAGRFAASYRFRRTFRTQRYQFRAQVIRQSGLRSARNSRLTSVTVRGRSR